MLCKRVTVTSTIATTTITRRRQINTRNIRHNQHHHFGVNIASKRTRLFATLVAAVASSSSFSSGNSIFTSTLTLSAAASIIMSSRTVRAYGNLPSKRFDYEPPIWAKDKFTNPPTKYGRLQLANLPTPIHRIPKSSVSKIFQDDAGDLDIKLYIKRDDMTGGVETGGNKIRKLEFLLADALAKKYKSVVTIGGEQSNHCRATAAAARMVGMKPNLILRTSRADEIQSKKLKHQSDKGIDEENSYTGVDEGIGITGNILYDRMVGTTIFTCTPGEYGRVGSEQLVARVCRHLKDLTDGTDDPYPIPVGGSNGIGTWGYIEGVDELLTQWKTIDGHPSLDHVVFACGSGGTAAGIALGMALSHGDEDVPDDEKPTVHAIGVCDNPDYFYGHCAKIANEMGFKSPTTGEESAEAFLRKNMVVYHGKGLGYAVNTPEELEFISKFALETGIVLDPVYSGKALYNFVQAVLKDKEAYRGTNILFWHTGGALGLFDKGNDIMSTLAEIAPTNRLDIYGKGPDYGIDISNPVE